MQALWTPTQKPKGKIQPAQHTAQEGDEKSRFTAFLSGNAAGKMDPHMAIVKCD